MKRTVRAASSEVVALLVETIAAYLETVHLVTDDTLWTRLRADIIEPAGKS